MIINVYNQISLIFQLHHLSSLPKVSHVSVTPTQPKFSPSCWILSKVMSLAIYVSINVLDYPVEFYQMSAWQSSASQRVLTLSLFNNDPPDF